MGLAERDGQAAEWKSLIIQKPVSIRSARIGGSPFSEVSSIIMAYKNFPPPLLEYSTNRARIARARRQHRGRRRGAAAVEFAIVLPVFLLLLVGILEFGRMVMVQQVLTNASREGARVAVLDGSTPWDVQTACNDFLANASVSGATVTVTPSSLTNAAPGSQVSVVTSVPFTQVTWVPTPWFSNNVTLSATCSMRREGIP